MKKEWLFVSARIVAVFGMISAVVDGISGKISTAEQDMFFILSVGIMVLAELWENNHKIDNITITHKIEIEAEKINEDDMGTGGEEQA